MIFKYLKRNRYILIFTTITLIANIIKFDKIDIILPILGLILAIIIDRYCDIRLIRNLKLLKQNQTLETLKVIENEDKFRKLFTLSNNPICIFNIKSMKFVNVNSSFCNLLGYTSNELTSQYFTNFIYEGDLDFAANKIIELINNEEPTEMIIRYVNNDGEVKKLLWNFCFTSDTTGLSYCWVKDLGDELT